MNATPTTPDYIAWVAMLVSLVGPILTYFAVRGLNAAQADKAKAEADKLRRDAQDAADKKEAEFNQLVLATARGLVEEIKSQLDDMKRDNVDLRKQLADLRCEQNIDRQRIQVLRAKVIALRKFLEEKGLEPPADTQPD